MSRDKDHSSVQSLIKADNGIYANNDEDGSFESILQEAHGIFSRNYDPASFVTFFMHLVVLAGPDVIQKVTMKNRAPATKTGGYEDYGIYVVLAHFDHYFLKWRLEGARAPQNYIGESLEFRNAMIIAAYFKESFAIREAYRHAGIREVLSDDVENEIEDLKARRKPFTDALKAFTDVSNAELEPAILKLQDKFPKLKEVKFESIHSTAFKRAQLLYEVWEERLKKEILDAMATICN